MARKKQLKRDAEIHIPLVFTSEEYRNRLKEHGYWLSEYVHTISRQDILVFAAAQYFEYFSLQNILDVIGGSPYRVRQSLQRLQAQGYIIDAGSLTNEKKYMYRFQQCMLFQSTPPNDVAMIAFPVWVMELITKWKLHADDLFLYSALWKWQYDSRVNKTHTNAYYTETNAKKWLGMSEITVKRSRKKLIECQLIRRAGSHKAVADGKEIGHRIADYYVVGKVDEYTELTGIKIETRKGAKKIVHAGEVVQFRKVKGA